MHVCVCVGGGVVVFKPIVAGKGKKVRRCQGEAGLLKTALNLPQFICKLFCSAEAATSYARQASAKVFP